MHKFQKTLTTFAQANASALALVPAMFLAVSLAAAGDDADDREGLRAIHAAFQTETGWVPRKVLDVAGAFKFTEYDYFKAWMMKRIAVKKGQEVDVHADREYTDWAALTDALDIWIDGLAMV
jgi:menaquinone-dependent protoporphyrinogen oxidase